jgi:two-component system, NtrC family, response regulator AtoC
MLEEVSEMSSSLQARVASVLQRPRNMKRGAEKTDLDVRILATNTAEVEGEGPEGKSGGELISRLSAFTIHVPPLRQRKEDIAVLLAHFMKKLARHYGLPTRNLSAHALEACLRYSWPGNVTELENFVKGYLMLGDDSLLMVGDGALGLRTVNVKFSPETPNGVAVPVPAVLTNLETAVLAPAAEPASLKTLVKNVKEEAEKGAIAGALDRTRWNRKAAARLLQISYRALLYKIERHQMRPPQA